MENVNEPSPSSSGVSEGQISPGGKMPPLGQAPRSRLVRLLHRTAVAWTTAAALALAVVGLSVALVTGNSTPARFPAPHGGGFPGANGSFGGAGGGGFRGGPGSFGGAGGTVGTVASVGKGTFILTARSGQTVTVDEQSTTTYYKGPTKTSSSTVVKGARVQVQGNRNGNTVNATSVVVLPPGAFGPGQTNNSPGQ